MRIWPHLLKKPLMENFIFCAVLAGMMVEYMIEDCPKYTTFIEIYSTGQNGGQTGTNAKKLFNTYDFRG